MALKRECYVINRIEGGPDFAIRADNDEGVYIPSKMAQHLELEDMDAIDAVFVRNTNDAEGANTTPWFAIRAKLIEEFEE